MTNITLSITPTSVAVGQSFSSHVDILGIISPTIIVNLNARLKGTFPWTTLDSITVASDADGFSIADFATAATPPTGLTEVIAQVFVNSSYNFSNIKELTITEAPPPQCTVDTDCPEGYHCENGVCVQNQQPPPPPPPSSGIIVLVVLGIGVAGILLYYLLKR